MEQSKRHAQTNCTCALGDGTMNFSSVLGRFSHQTCLNSYQRCRRGALTACCASLNQPTTLEHTQADIAKEIYKIHAT